MESEVPEEPANAPQIFEEKLTLPQPDKPNTLLFSPQIIHEEEYESNLLKEITNSGLSESGVPEAPVNAPQILEDQLTLPQP